MEREEAKEAVVAGRASRAGVDGVVVTETWGTSLEAGATGIELTGAATEAAYYKAGTAAASLCSSVSAKSAASDAAGVLIYICIYGF